MKARDIRSKQTVDNNQEEAFPKVPIQRTVVEILNTRSNKASFNKSSSKNRTSRGQANKNTFVVDNKNSSFNFVTFQTPNKKLRNQSIKSGSNSDLTEVAPELGETSPPLLDIPNPKIRDDKHRRIFSE